MPHNIPIADIEKHTCGISVSRRTQVANLQKYIQGLLGDTHHTFLQGSYKNDTSTSDINDVDIVAIRLTTYSSVHSAVQTTGSIPWDSIFTEIEQKLRNQSVYQWTVERQDKCIEVRTSNFKADVVPAVQISTDHTEDPIAIYSFSKFAEKVNHPRTHYENGVSKNQSTNQNYKPVVRMFKNWAANQFDDTDTVSSYQIESLVHAVPDELFYNDHAVAFVAVGNHIVKLLARRDVIPFQIHSVCGSEDITLNWDIAKRQHFKNKLTESIIHGLEAHKVSTVQEARQHWNRAFNV